MESQVGDLVEQALRELFESAQADGYSVEAPRGYPHLGLAIVDSIFSLRTRYGAVVRVLDTYCSQVPELSESDARFRNSEPSHDVHALLNMLDGRSEEELVALFGNEQYAPGTRVRKAVVVRQVADALKDKEVFTADDIRVRWADASVEASVRDVPGVGHAAWRYILTLSGVQRVKPDTMVTAWVRRASGEISLTPIDAAELLEEAARRLSHSGVDITVRAADHLVWRQESGRLK